MQFVVDSNEYIFAFGPFKEPNTRLLFDVLLDKSPLHGIRIPRMIFKEVKRNLSPEAFQEFNNFISTLTTIEEDVVVPFEIAFKYEAKGFKGADAFIAAFTEWTGSEVLVTENRHFLSLHGDLPFKVLTAEECLNLIEHL